MFTKYENGAEVDIEEVYRYENGAEVEAEAVYAYKNGAEVEVWSNAGDLSWYMENDNRDYCNVDFNKDTNKITCQVSKGEADHFYLLAYGEEFVNPTITFEYEGGAWTGEEYIVAGTLYVVGIDSDGNKTRETIVTVGKSGDTTYGTVSKTINGTFAEVGIQMLFRGSTSQSDDYFAYLDIYDFLIDGKKYKL